MQGLLLIVQRRVTEVPVASPVTPEVGEDGVVMLAVPETMVHKPVPSAGTFPASVATVSQRSWSGPAFEAVGVAATIIFTSSLTDAHGGSLTVHRRVTVPVTSPVSPDVG